MKKTDWLKIKKIGFVIKHHQHEAQELASQIAMLLMDRGFQLYFCDECSPFVKKLSATLKTKFNVVKKVDLPKNCDLIIVLGGDGTFLSVARLMKNETKPVLGVNMGTLGFLTETRRDEVFDILNRILHRGEGTLSERLMLQVSVRRKKKTIFEGLAVNDAVVSKGAIARIVSIRVDIDGTFASMVRADGLIISTPTGSTAYSVAAGGPIVSPKMDCMILTPICGHGLTQRAVVIPHTSDVCVKMDHMPGHVYLTVDGQEAIDLKDGDEIHVQQFVKHKLKVVTSPSRNFFMLLREKLNFGGKL